jgi:predicted acylesterase/phospholipase RssA
MPSDENKPDRSVAARDESGTVNSHNESANDPMEEFTPFAVMFAVLIAWIAFCTIFVYGFVEGIKVYIGATLITGLLMAIVGVVITLTRIMDLWWLPAGLYTVPFSLWFFFGHYNVWRDYLAVTVILVLVAAFGGETIKRILAHSTLPDKGRLKKILQILQALSYLLLVWALTTIGDHVMGPFWTSQHPLFQKPTAIRSDSLETGQRRVAVALSGGGFRATIMHAGVLDALDRLDVNIAALSTVSGGSIVGGFYALGGTPVRLKDAIIERRFNLRRDILSAHNLLRLPIPGRITIPAFGRSWLVPLLPFRSSFSRTDVLAEQLDRVLFNKASLHDVQNRKGPMWIIATTDLLSGDAVGISPSGLYRRALPVTKDTESLGYVPRVFKPPSFEQSALQSVSVSRVVAASCAFPGAFAPVSFEYRGINEGSQKKLMLSDGGVTDNSGLALLLAAWAQPPPSTPRPFDVVIASNGGKSLAQMSVEEDFSGPFRALDVIYSTSGVYVPESEGRNNKGPKIIRLSPEFTLPESTQMVKSLINWATRRRNDVPPVTADQLRAVLERELSDATLHRLKRLEPIERPKQMAKIWQTVVEKSRDNAFNDERMTARLDVVLDFINAWNVFDLTPTLSDVLPSDDINALFRLGRYLVNLASMSSDY